MRKSRSGVSRGPRNANKVKRGKGLDVFSIESDDAVHAPGDLEGVLDDGDDEVKSEDDEDIDSDEAFGESDEEKYSTFKFSGSSSRNKQVHSFLRVAYNL